jgi:nicotinamide mononucleotide (NMN) deamidase PncC
MIIMTIMAMTEGTKYRSATDVGVAVGAAVADAGGEYSMEVSAVEPK